VDAAVPSCAELGVVPLAAATAVVLRPLLVVRRAIAAAANCTAPIAITCRVAVSVARRPRRVLRLSLAFFVPALLVRPSPPAGSVGGAGHCSAAGSGGSAVPAGSAGSASARERCSRPVGRKHSAPQAARIRRRARQERVRGPPRPGSASIEPRSRGLRRLCGRFERACRLTTATERSSAPFVAARNRQRPCRPPSRDLTAALAALGSWSSDLSRGGSKEA